MVQNKASTSNIFIKTFSIDNAFYILSFCECSTFFFINEIYETPNLSGGMI